MKNTSLGRLEQQVMDIVWNYQECSVREVLSEISKNRKLAYTTIATILQRLNDKGMVERKVEGLSYIYSPALSKKSYSKKIAKSFIKKFVHSFGDIAIASFAQSIESLPKEKRKYFLKLLKNR